MRMLPIRVGVGYDIHRLEKGDFIILGGVKIPSMYKTIAHSDGDVLLHALGEAMLGAMGLSDLGTYFPDNIEKTKGMDSSLIIKFALEKMDEKGYVMGNADISVILEKPKLKDYIPSIKKNLAALLNIPEDDISLKAGTNEGEDGVGRQEAVVSFASVTIVRKDQ